ncbi:MAG: hypothetical protein ACTTKL_02950 [Treponema sp.]
MTSSNSRTSAALVPDQNDCLSPRLLELRKKIHNKDYIDSAIQRIAHVISKKLVEDPDELRIMI